MDAVGGANEGSSILVILLVVVISGSCVLVMRLVVVMRGSGVLLTLLVVALSSSTCGSCAGGNKW